MKRLGICEQNFDRRRFVEQLIVPAYQQGLARLFLREGFPLRIHGRGWQQIPEFSTRVGGALRTREELLDASRDAVLVHAWAWAPAHPIESVGPRILRPSGSRQSCLNTARRLLGGMSPPATQRDPLTAQKILTLL